MFCNGSIGPSAHVSVLPATLPGAMDAESRLRPSSGSLIDRYDAVTFKAIDRLEPSGNCGAPWQLLSTADGTELINASQSRVCFYKLNEPVSTAVKARAHDSYVCGAACMMRNYRNKAAVDVRATPQRQHPVRTIE
jgi:hypothetical protein